MATNPPEPPPSALPYGMSPQEALTEIRRERAEAEAEAHRQGVLRDKHQRAYDEATAKVNRCNAVEMALLGGLQPAGANPARPAMAPSNASPTSTTDSQGSAPLARPGSRTPQIGESFMSWWRDAKDNRRPRKQRPTRTQD